MATQAIKVTWFTDSPDAGEKTCICSVCGELITAHEHPLRVWTDEAEPLEARFHDKCWNSINPHFKINESLKG